MPLSVRQEMMEALTGTDSIDRPCPHKLSGFRYMATFTQAGLQRKEVPESHFEIGEHEGATVATVKCPCGHKPVVEVAEYPTQCDCHRWFFFDGTQVWSLLVAA